MSLIIQTVFSNLIDWLFKPLDSLCSNILTGAFSGMVGSMSNDEWNIAITVANRIGWIMGFVNMALCVIGALQAAAKGSVIEIEVDGSDEAAAMQALTDLINDYFGEGE